MTKIIFMGTPDFSTPILKAVHEKYGVVAVVTQPDKPVGRKKILTPSPVKQMATELNIKVFTPEKLSSSSELEQLIDMAPDLIITAAYGQLLPERLLKAPTLGSINVHASLLPKYRGGAPIHYAIMNGETETGVTIMYMVKQLDAGDIISQRVHPIGENDNVGQTFERLSDIGVQLLMDTLPSILEGTNERRPQNSELATFASNIKREDEFVTFNRPTEDVHNHIRGLSPWPVGYAKLNGQNIKLWAAVKDTGNSTPGEIIRADKTGIVVATEDGAIKLTEIQVPGKKRMSAGSYVLGLKTDLKGQQFNE